MGRRQRPRGSYGPEEGRGGRRGRIRGALDLVIDTVVEAIGELALYAIGWGLVALIGLGFAFYPRETLASVSGVLTLAVWAVVLLARSARARAAVPRGWLTIAAMCSLGLVVLVFAYGYPWLEDLPDF